jgi:diacylglycerol kinase family enzyme
MTKKRSKIYVVHSPSQSVLDSLDQIRVAFSELNYEAAFLPLDDSTTKRVQKLIQSEIKILCAAGGDGTQNAVAGMIGDAPIRLGVIPVGTLNHFAKDIGTPIDIAESVKTILHGHARSFDVAEVNGKVFLNNSSIGLYPNIVTFREKHEGTIGKWPAAVWASLRGLTHWPTYRIRIEIDGHVQHQRTPMVIIGNNSYGVDQPGMTNRSGLTDGRLSVYLFKTTSRAKVVQIVLKTLVGRGEEERDFGEHLAREVIISSRHRRLKVSRDGEVDRLESPLKYTIRPRHLKVMVPSEKA